MTIEATQTVPITVTDDGTIRVTGTRVSLDSIVHHFKLGATAEQIAHKFPAASLADIYACLAYYSSHRAEVEEYLRQQEAYEDAAQAGLESNLQYQSSMAELRERLLARWAAKQQAA